MRSLTSIAPLHFDLILRLHPSALCLLSLASQYQSTIKACVAVTTSLTEPYPDLLPPLASIHTGLPNWLKRPVNSEDKVAPPPPAAQRGYLADEYE